MVAPLALVNVYESIYNEHSVSILGGVFGHPSGYLGTINVHCHDSTYITEKTLQMNFPEGNLLKAKHLHEEIKKPTGKYAILQPLFQYQCFTGIF